MVLESEIAMPGMPAVPFSLRINPTCILQGMVQFQDFTRKYVRQHGMACPLDMEGSCKYIG
jgi:hypothetical protein